MLNFVADLICNFTIHLFITTSFLNSKLNRLLLFCLLYLPSFQVRHSESTSVRYDATKASEQSLATLPKETDGPWKEDGLNLKPCWPKPVLGLISSSCAHFTSLFMFPSANL